MPRAGKKPAPRRQRPLWTCPRCGNRFVTANMWHSCLRAGVDASLDDHFKGKAPHIRGLFEAWLACVEEAGPVTVIPQKTRICFQARVRFGGAVIRKSHVLTNFWLKRAVSHPLFRPVEFIAPHYHIYRIRLTDARQLDTPGLRELLDESYRLGQQLPPGDADARRAADVKPRKAKTRKRGRPGARPAADRL